MSESLLSLVFLLVAIAVLYRYVIPYLFPAAVHNIGVVKLNKDSGEVYVFQGGGIPMASSQNRSQAKVDTRRRNRVFEKAMV